MAPVYMHTTYIHIQPKYVCIHVNSRWAHVIFQRNPQNRKYITYRIAIRRVPNMCRKFSEFGYVVLEYANGQTNKQNHRETKTLFTILRTQLEIKCLLRNDTGVNNCESYLVLVRSSYWAHQPNATLYMSGRTSHRLLDNAHLSCRYDDVLGRVSICRPGSCSRILSHKSQPVIATGNLPTCNNQVADYFLKFLPYSVVQSTQFCYVIFSYVAGIC